MGEQGEEGSITNCYASGTITGGICVGGLLGLNYEGTISKSSASGAVSGERWVGGLVGATGVESAWTWDIYHGGRITTSSSTGMVSGGSFVGGLVGANGASITQSYSSGMVVGNETCVGGLIGWNDGDIAMSYSRGEVSGVDYVGGLVSWNTGGITDSYSSGAVAGVEEVGGLVGSGGGTTKSFWDITASGQGTSTGGLGLTTSEMQDPTTFTDAGWDFVGELDGPSDVWAEPSGGGYPVLWWQLSSLPELPVFQGGSGEPNDPYLISTPDQLNSIGYNPRLMDSHFKVTDDLDLRDLHLYPIGHPVVPYRGIIDGNDHVISNLTVEGEGYLGLISYLGAKAEAKDFGAVDVNVTGSQDVVAGLVGYNSGGTVSNCFVTGTVSGKDRVGGLVGVNHSEGRIIQSSSSAEVIGGRYVGGLVGINGDDEGGWGIHDGGAIIDCFASGKVTGVSNIGGLMGGHGYAGSATNCHSDSTVTGQNCVGGLNRFKLRQYHDELQ